MILSRQSLLVAGLLTLVWSGVAVVMRMTDDAVSSPETVLGLMEATEWSDVKSLSATERRERFDKVISKMNRLNFAERAEMREEGEVTIQSFVDGLTDEEKSRYVDQTVVPYFESIMKGLKAMPETDREQFLVRLRRDLKSRPPPGTPEEFAMADEETFREVMDDGLESYFRDASVETKLKFAPVLEDIQRRLQGFGRR